MPGILRSALELAQSVGLAVDRTTSAGGRAGVA